ncbi:VTT domain-containing protein [Enterococcus saccharolyticus]|uniref:Cytochrome O ubiquinol oxidase n=1 Tax=Candidatus Enterococcus willemsii TaxID=1857215 RepID=A0ABQ6Z0D9_9ENTE|nr:MULTISPECIES: VTT domain-containing protein [Enterococcus]KAF1304040.1 cytochrome O ubiquinol oxidase [Enterococcus sp. CU12B]MCD5002099.1 VTT domain-containing protein [Enterococcus saccharolyticus]
MFIVDFILHVDEHLLFFVEQYGAGIYPLLFLILFIETGLVIFPFLPGDSLLFAGGALSAISSSLSLPLILLTCMVASILGNTVNYFLGRKIGTHALYDGPLSKWIKAEEVQKAENFFNEKGKYTIFIGRFLPFIRTFVPFIAGSTKMHRKTFMFLNVISGISWVLVATLAGYFLGNIPFINAHFSMIMLAIIMVSLLPMLLSVVKGWQQSKKVSE